MTDINDGPGNALPAAPEHPAIDRTTATRGSAATPTSTACSGSCAHPGIVMRPGPTGPRAGLVDGPDVWEVIGARHALRDEDPARHGEALRGDLRTVTGLTTAQVVAALDYYTAHPEDVDTRITVNTETAERAQRPQPAAGRPTNQAT